MNTNPAPERTWSLSSNEVKTLSHASGSDYVYALTEDEHTHTRTQTPNIQPPPQTADRKFCTHTHGMSVGMHTE